MFGVHGAIGLCDNKRFQDIPRIQHHRRAHLLMHLRRTNPRHLCYDLAVKKFALLLTFKNLRPFGEVLDHLTDTAVWIEAGLKHPI